MDESKDITIRTRIREGDIRRISRLHGDLYSMEFGYDHTFEEHVEGLLADLMPLDPGNERFWIAERGDDIVGCVAVAKGSDGGARLRFMLVHPDVRGRGLGRKLLSIGIDFARSRGYPFIYLTTQPTLERAGMLYRSAGFRLTRERKEKKWGHVLFEQRYEMDLGSG